MNDDVVVRVDFGSKAPEKRADGQQRDQRPSRHRIPKGVASVGVLRAPKRPMHHQHPFAFLPNAQVTDFVDIPTRSRISLALTYQVTQSDEDLRSQVGRCEVLYTDTSGAIWSYAVTGFTVAAASDGWTIELHLDDRTEIGFNSQSQYKDCVVVCCGDRKIHTSPFQVPLAS